MSPGPYYTLGLVPPPRIELGPSGSDPEALPLHQGGTRASGESRTLTLSLEDFGLPCRQTHGDRRGIRTHVAAVTVRSVRPGYTRRNAGLPVFATGSVGFQSTALLHKLEPVGRIARICPVVSRVSDGRPYYWTTIQYPRRESNALPLRFVAWDAFRYTSKVCPQVRVVRDD